LSAKIFPPALLGLKKKRIVIVGDGILQYIPFAALPIADSKKITLIDRHEVINLPSSSTLAMLRQKRDLDTKKSKTLAIFADPVFSLEDERVTIKPNNNSDAIAQTDINLISLNRSQKELNLEDWDRLKWTGIEANKILNLVSPTQRKEFLNFDADLSQLKEVELGKYKIVHFATHGLVNTESPELSGLVLSLLDRNGRAKNGFLRLHEIYNLNLSATEIVVLSACQTGLGQEIRGEGLVGLTRGFMYAGAKRVLVSLWSVDDRATAELMERFYYYLLEKKLSATEALKAAQAQLKNIYPNPYYWAGFVIQGDWR
jgi:CHAT domain-containing protein